MPSIVNSKISMIKNNYKLFQRVSTVFRMKEGGGGGEGGGKRTSLPIFPLKLLQTWDLAPKSFWLLVLIFLPHWCKISGPYVVPVPTVLNLNQDYPSRNMFFWSNPYKIEVLLTSVIEMLQLRNFGHMTIFTIWFESLIKICCWRQRHKLWRHKFYFKIPL